MKGIKLLLAVCLAPLTFYGATADDGTDAARAAVRRTPANTVSVTRQKSTASEATAPQSAPAISRTTNLSGKQNVTPAVVGRTSPNQRGGNTISNTDRSEHTTPSTSTRTTSATVKTRTPTTSGQSQTRATTTRSGVSRTSQPVPDNTTRTNVQTAPRNSISRAALRGIARSATSEPQTMARDKLISGDAKKCRDIYYSCMDEFCANKDAILKRCACSNRIHEFDGVKKNLSTVEEKMLNFNQRLLTVNMEKEDAAALYKATEGELAFNQKDTSASKKILDEIAKKLNTSFDDRHFERDLSPISLSLNVDAAFDSIDSLQGASTTTKNGTELYTAALPVCREMAHEVCTDDELAIAESGYQMQIEQDCNTVAKSYQAQTDTARARVREGGALLDMSRLDIYQKRNSDDILTCKRKMLDMLTDSSVCGSNMGKCLDVSGRYIDPSTGQAFLTADLSNISNLISRPTNGQTWTTAPGNAVFVSFLNSRKKFLEPAMEHCQDIADNVWNDFIEDALAQIKLAQDKKLEDVRQSCTTLTTQCLSDTAKSIAEFDARALSIFGVKADKTVSAMCADVTNACSALLNSNIPGSDTDWIGGMTEIANAKTFDTILQTCREVGRACIVQVCTSIAGNFGLCENIQSSINRKSIINRTACWDQVVNCVRDAGTDKISAIMAQLGKQPSVDTGYKITNNNFYTEVYGESKSTDSNCTGDCVFDICATECYYDTPPTSAQISNCEVCRIAERIWGNCENKPTTLLTEANAHNKIIIPENDDTGTLLAWFAKNTGTTTNPQSCRDTSCPAGQVLTSTENGNYCILSEIASVNADNCGATDAIYYPADGIKNCCTNYTTNQDVWGNCLDNAPTQISGTPMFGTTNINATNVYLSALQHKLVASWHLNEPADKYPQGDYVLICVGDTNTGSSEPNTEYPGGTTITCNGTFVAINLDTGHYFTPGNQGAKTNVIDAADTNGTTCAYTLTSGAWETDTGKACPIEEPTKWHIKDE